MPHSKYYDCPRCGLFMFYGPCDNPKCVAEIKEKYDKEIAEIRKRKEEYWLSHPDEFDGPCFGSRHRD